MPTRSRVNLPDEPLVQLLMAVVFVLMMVAGVSAWLAFLAIAVIVAIESAVELLRKPDA